MRLLNKTALVTGAARGIGKGCAIELARAGADIVINDFGRADEAAATVEEIQQLGRRATFIDANAFDRTACQELVRQAIETLGGRLDILVSNPAFSRRGDFLTYDPELFEKTLAGTLAAGFHVSQFAAQHMVQRGGGGKIVFISSVHAEIGYVRSVAYNAAKAGVNHMARTIAAELLPHRINVNVIEPGWIETPGEHATFGADVLREQGQKLPWGRIGQPSDIGKAAAFLSSDDADYITGTCLVVDGGFLLRAAL